MLLTIRCVLAVKIRVHIAFFWGGWNSTVGALSSTEMRCFCVLREKMLHVRLVSMTTISWQPALYDLTLLQFTICFFFIWHQSKKVNAKNIVVLLGYILTHNIFWYFEILILYYVIMHSVSVSVSLSLSADPQHSHRHGHRVPSPPRLALQTCLEELDGWPPQTHHPGQWWEKSHRRRGSCINALWSEVL